MHFTLSMLEFLVSNRLMCVALSGFLSSRCNRKMANVKFITFQSQQEKSTSVSTVKHLLSKIICCYWRSTRESYKPDRVNSSRLAKKNRRLVCVNCGLTLKKVEIIF